MSHSFVSRFLARALSVGVTVSIILPSGVHAASVNVNNVGTLLNARNAQTVTRADFIRAAVKASGLLTPQQGSVPYTNVPDALLPYVRAAELKGALKIFASEGKALKFSTAIRRGEAIDVLTHLLQVTPMGGSDAAAAKFTDAVTPADRSRVSLALEKGWLKPASETVFGLKQILRGKEGSLLLTRAFQLAAPSQQTDTFSAPVIRVRLESISRQPAPKADMLEAIWNTLRTNYLYRDRLDVDKAGDKAIEALVNSLSDPYTTYMPKQRNEDFKLQMKGEVEGIGATVEMTGGILTIVSPLRSSPAEKAGLKPKDKIISIDGEKLQGLTLDEAVRKVRGPKGSSVVLVIQRDGAEFEVTVTREKVVVPEVEINYRERGVAVVKILQFWDTTDKKFRDAMAEVQSKSPSGIILDLRNNPGGLLHAAGVVIGNFIPKASAFVSIMESSSTSTDITTDEPTIHSTVPMVVLINKGSASASEIVAGALQDANRAKIVGETSYGKGTVQQVMQFQDGSSLKYTVAEWRTPLGRKIDKLGVKPDVVVTNDGAPPGRDLQMEKAMELLR